MKEKLLKNKWLIATVALAVVAVAAIIVAIVLGVTGAPDDDERIFGVGEEGVYYYEVVDGKVTLTLRDGTFTMSGKINKTGLYSVDGSTITLDFYKDEDGTATATLNGNDLGLVIGETNYSLVKEVEYTVSFNVGGGTAIPSVKVVNGKTVGKPATDPVKENNVFLGWYADEAFTTPFAFDEAVVKSDVTVYARWAERISGVPDYVVSFELGYEGAEALAPLTTVSGVAYGMPTPERQGYTFGGWWFSMYEDGDKLTSVYKEGTVFTADTTLYAVWYDSASAKLNAPAVSVSENMISWDAVKGAVSYKLTVTAPDGTLVIDGETVTSTVRELRFAELAEGEYVISVVAVAQDAANNSESADRSYANKTLDRVTDIYVENGILIFGAVENAEKYLINIDCGNDDHSHTDFDNGTSTTYYLANCKMQKGGILITVTATAKGYASSVSKVFVYDKTLAAVEGLKYDENGDRFVWNAVAGTANYVVTVKIGNDVLTFNNGTATSFSAAPFTGAIEVSVVPETDGYNSPAAATASCSKTAPAAPNGLLANGNTILWNAVEGAASYEVNVGGQTVTVDTNSLNIVGSTLVLAQGETYTVKVKAVNENGESSSFSESVEIGYFVMDPDLTYANKTVYWSPVLGVEQYQVRVNGGEIITVIGERSAKITLTKEGANLVEVRYVYDGEFSEWASVTVNAFAVEYDTRTVAFGAVMIEYLAVGDELSLPADGFSLEGYDFTGWYNAPKGAAGNGKLYAEGCVFTGNAYTVVYAEWTPKTYSVTLNVDALDFNVTNIVTGSTEPATYTKSFTLPVPEAQNTGMYYFAGWYTGTAGTGTKITDENGVSVAPYPFTRDVTVYPYYSTNALKFELQDDGTYSVTKGDTINTVTTLKIPVTYNEIPVSIVLENAFSGCTTLTRIELPDTVKLVGTGAFNGCTKLEYIDVYEARPGEVYETFYSDDDGVLIREDMGTTWLEFFPRAKTGEYTISNEVEMILPKAFYMAKISKLTIPKSINTIPEYAIYECKALEELVFEGGRTTPIEFVAKSFYYASYSSVLESITFPAMMNVELSVIRSMSNYHQQLTTINVEEGGTAFASVGGLLTDATKQTILYCPRGYAGEITIPKGVTAIGPNAFEYCDNITSVTIPVWVTEIGKYAFQYCDGIKSITFQGSRSEDLNIIENAFQAAYNVETITFEGNGTDTLDTGKITMGRMAFYGSSYSAKLHTVTIGDGVNIDSIANQAFQTQSSLRTFEVSEKAYIGSIGEKAFEKCVSLTSFKVPATVKSIATNAFNGCTKLSKLEFATAEGEPELTLATLAFNGCTSLTTVELPDRLKTFDSSAFEGCSALKAITVKPTNTKYLNDKNGILYAKNVDENDNVVFTELLFYPKALVAENNGVINNLPETLTTIGGSAFSDNNRLVSIVIPAKVTTIGANAFANCQALSSVQFSPAAATAGESAGLTIGDSAFINCTSLTDDFRLPANTTSIGNAAFQGCPFTKFVIPEGITYLGFAIFWGSDTLEEVEFKCTGDFTIENGTANNASKGGIFGKCTALTRVDFPASMTRLGNYAFYGAVNLETVNFGTVTVVDGEYTTDSKLVSIGNRAFEQCNALESIVIPKTVTAIGTNALAGQSATLHGSLKNVIFEKGGTEELHFAAGVFKYQAELVKIDLPERVSLYVGQTAFQRKNGSTALKDANNNNIYSAPTPSATVNITGLSQTFNGCLSLAEVNIIDEEGVNGLYSTVDGVLYNADKTVLIFCPFANLGTNKETRELIVPKSVELVLTYAFNDCTELKTVTFEEYDKTDANYGKQLLTIGNYTPTSTSATTTGYMTIGGKTSTITKVSLPSHLKEVSYHAFFCGTATIADVEELESMEIIFNLDATNVIIEKYAFHYSTVKALALPGIKSIGDYAFYGTVNLESISFASLDKSIKKLPNYMLCKAKALKSFDIPAQITEIGTNVFDECTSLTSLVVPTTVTKLGNYAFRGTGLTSFTLHSGFTNTTLGTYLFANCADLKTFTFEAKADGKYPITQIPNYMFQNCTSLESINIDAFASQITKVGNSAFYKCESLPAFDFTKFTALTTVTSNCFSYNPHYTRIDLSKTKITDITTAFNNLANLEEFIFPETLTKNIASGSFTNDDKLARVYLPSNYTSAWMANVNSYIVQKSDVAVEVIIPATNKNFALDELGIVYDPQMQTIYFASPSVDLSGYTIPDSVVTIGAYAFAYNPTSVDLVIPEGVKTIEANAFTYSGINSVVIPSTVTDIKNNAFNHSELTSVTFTDTLELPSQLTSLGSSVFSFSKLVDVVLPDGLTTFGGTYIFGYMDTLKSVTTGASMKEIPNGFIAYTPSLEHLNMQEGIETIRWIFSSDYYIGDYGAHQMTSINIPASVKVIEADAFCDMTGLKTVTFAEGSLLEKLGDDAFNHCTSLETIEGLPTSLATLGAKAFKDCTSLKSLDLSATGVTEILTDTFRNTESMAEFKLPANVASIGDTAFFNSGIENLFVPATVTTIGISAFENSALKTVTFPSASVLTSLGEMVDEDGDDIWADVFRGTYQLETVILPNTLKTIARGAFANSAVKNVLMADDSTPSSLECIGDSAFESCANLTGFAYLDQVTEIGEKAFFCCSSLENTVVADSLTTLGAMAFAFCDKLTTAYVPASLVNLGGNPYAGLDAAKISISENNKAFRIVTDENGTVTLYDADMITVYGVYGATGVYVIENGVSGLAYAPGALAGNAITEANVPGRLETVPAYMFMNCEQLTAVTLAEELTEIGQYAFYNTGLTTVDIPAVTTIGDYAFAYCDNINDVVIPKTAVTIGNYVFAYCETLSNFDFESFEEGESVKTQKVGTHFFFNCPNITEVILPDKINITAEDKADSGISYTNDIPSYMFAGTGIVNANIYENGVAFYFFTRGVFANCKSLVSVYIEEIPDHSGSSYGYCSTTYFEGCDKLEAIYIDSLDKTAYVIGNMANGYWPELHVKNSVKDETTDPLNSTAYVEKALNESFEVHFDADTYVDLIDYFANLNDSWIFQVYDKDGNRLYCSETDGSIAYVEDAEGNVIWQATAAE